MRHLNIALPLLLSFAFAFGAETNSALRSLKEQDQTARSGPLTAIDWSVVAVQDSERRSKVAEMLRSGTVRTSEDYYNAALIYQHGEAADDIRLAYSLANIAVSIDPSNKEAKWLTAAAWDRTMMRLGKPQWYGTQFSKPSPDAPWELYKIDESAVSDGERKEFGVPSLAESKKRAATIH